MLRGAVDGEDGGSHARRARKDPVARRPLHAEQGQHRVSRLYPFGIESRVTIHPPQVFRVQVSWAPVQL